MPPHIAHVYPTAPLLESMHRTHIIADIHQKWMNWNISLWYYCKITVSYNLLLKCHQYATSLNYSTYIYRGNMPIYMPHMRLLSSMMLAESVYTYDDAGQWWCKMTMTSLPNCIYWVGHLAKAIKRGKRNTILFTKPTDSHIYLNYYSEHPTTLKKSIPYLQFCRLKRIHPVTVFTGSSNTYLLLLPIERLSTQWNCASKRTIKFSPLNTPISTKNPGTETLSHLYWSQYTTGPSPILRKSFPNIGHILVGLAPQGVWKR